MPKLWIYRNAYINHDKRLYQWWQRLYQLEWLHYVTMQNTWFQKRGVREWKRPWDLSQHKSFWNGFWPINFLVIIVVMMMMMMMIIMTNYFCGMVDRRKAFRLITSRGQCQRSSESWVWTSAEPEFRIKWMKLCSGDNHCIFQN